jgi:hypothetical protein
LAVLLLMLSVLSLGPLHAGSMSAALPRRDEAQRALAWLRAQQMSDGGFAAFTDASDPGVTADVVLAFVAANLDPRSVESAAGHDPLDFLIESAQAVAANPPLAAKVGLALHGAAANPRDTGGVDLVGVVQGAFDQARSWYGVSFYGHLYALLLLHSQGVPIEAAAIDAVIDAQTPEGSWGFNGDPTAGTGDSNTTALAVQVLAAIDAGAAPVDGGLAYLLSLQAEDGSIAYDARGGPNLLGDANSTALTIQAVLAMRWDPAQTPGGDLLAALATFQNPSGAFQFQPAFPDDSLLATAQAVPALLLQAFPLDPVSLDSPVRDAARPATPKLGCEFHELTQHNVCGEFRDYWHARGGLAIFGYPLTEELDYFGLNVQYFERARFEWHPQLAGTPYEVLLTRLGASEFDQGYRAWEPRATPRGDCAYADVTGHNVCGAMARYWETYGGLSVFGYPLTESFTEGDATVQYFERARFEHRPGRWPARMDILLGRLGSEDVERELAR